MIELDKEELVGRLRFNQKKIAIYFYTPLCGTCKLAGQMLEIAQQSLPHVDVYSCNINHVSSIAHHWQITSIPCLVIVDKQDIINKVYALKSVSDIYELLHPLADQ